MVIVVFDNNVHIEDSYKVGKLDMPEVLNIIRLEHPDNDVLKNRSNFTMVLEWCVHNFCHSIGFKRESTADVDLDYPQKWYITAAYVVVGVLVWVFVRWRTKRG